MPEPSRSPRCRRIAALVLTLAAVAAGARAEIAFADDESLAFDRPEAWAMAWFAAVALPSALGAPHELRPGELEASLEGGWIPTLSEEQRTVGFFGNKPEDLNRTSAFGRLRLSAGLPGRLALTAGWVPPVDIGGIEPELYALALARPLWEGQRWTVAARLFGENGSFRGDITCPEDAAAAGPDRERNPFDCRAPSRDEMRLRLYGLELQAGGPLDRWPRLSPYVTVAASRLDAEFRVRARYGNLVDTSVLSTAGTLWSATAGMSLLVRDRVRLTAEVFYAPLDVVRQPGGESDRDGLLNMRGSVAYRLR